jgi:hypothetical protein
MFPIPAVESFRLWEFVETAAKRFDDYISFSFLIIGYADF